MSDASHLNYLRQVQLARQYAEADKSDPFAFSRALTHIRQGLCRPLSDGRQATYSTTPDTETRRTLDGKEYTVVVHRNVQRP